MSQGTNSVQQSSGPPQQFLNAYSAVNQTAQNVAGQPYQQYPGNLVAPFSPDQSSGIAATESANGVQVPYLNAAANYINNSMQPVVTPNVSNYITAAASPAVTNAAAAGAGGVSNAAAAGAAGVTNAAGAFNPASINQFVNPYTNQVVGATQQQFNLQNQQQQQQLAGNAISQGAFGGDRDAVAQSLLAGQQTAAEAPVIANLESQGYQTGVGAAEQQAALGLQGATTAAGLGLTGATTAGQMGMQGATTQAQLEQGAGQTLLGANEAQGWLGSQAGYGMANLGNEALTTGLEGANALLGVGGLEQQEAQENLNVPYEQYIAQQAYPFQTTGWLANIAEGLGSSAGGTSSTTYPSASTGSQLAGGALAGAGILGETGAFGNTGYLSNLFGSAAGGVADPLGLGTGVFSARGGMVPARAPGGSVPDVTLGIFSPSSAGYVPTGGAAAHGMSPMWNADQSTTQTSGGGGFLNDVLPVVGLAAHFLRSGGAVPHRAAGGTAPISVTVGANGIPQLVQGASPAAGMQAALPSAVSNYLSNVQAMARPPTVAQPVAAASAPVASPASMMPMSLVPGVGTQANLSDSQIAALMQNPGVMSQEAQQYASPNATVSFGGQNYLIPNNGYAPPGRGGDGGGQARGGIVRRDAGGGMQPAAPMSADGPVPPAQAPSGGDPWRALMDVGFGVMGGRSPDAMTNIGQGALQGLKLYDEDGMRRAQMQSAQQRAQIAANESGQRMAETHRHNMADEDTALQRLEASVKEAQARIADEDKNVALHSQSVGIEGSRAAEAAAHDRAMEGLAARPDYGSEVGTDAAGNPVLVDRHTGKTVPLTGVTPKAGAGRDPLADQFRANAMEDANARALMNADPTGKTTYAQALTAVRQQRGAAGNAPLPNAIGNGQPSRPNLPMAPTEGAASVPLPMVTQGGQQVPDHTKLQNGQIYVLPGGQHARYDAANVGFVPVP